MGSRTAASLCQRLREGQNFPKAVQGRVGPGWVQRGFGLGCRCVQTAALLCIAAFSNSANLRFNAVLA